jgi:hypothetical protein
VDYSAFSNDLPAKVITASNRASNDEDTTAAPAHGSVVLTEAEPQPSPQPFSLIKAAIPAVNVAKTAPQPADSTIEPNYGGPTGWTLVTGLETNFMLGMSYKNPSVGAFARVHRTSRGRLGAWSTTEMSNDRKTYNKDGQYFVNKSEVGFRLSKVFTPTVVSYFGRQSNSVYTKAMASVGMGMRAALDNRTSVYAQYLFPDFLSFNHARRAVWGFETYASYGRKMMGFIGFEQSWVMFDQPRNGEVDLLNGMTVGIKTGIVFGKSNTHGH